MLAIYCSTFCLDVSKSLAAGSVSLKVEFQGVTGQYSRQIKTVRPNPKKHWMKTS
jgi:hypothetical protein